MKPDLVRPKSKDSRAGRDTPRTKPRDLPAIEGDLNASRGNPDASGTQSAISKGILKDLFPGVCGRPEAKEAPPDKIGKLYPAL